MAVLGDKADNNAELMVDGQALKKEEKVVYLLNKPKNIISSAADDRGRKTVVDLVASEYRLYPLGRLDYDSSGLILLSNDGELMQALLHPKYEVEKTYEVTIRGLITDDKLQRLQEGVDIDGYRTAEAKVRLLRQNENKKTSYLEVTIHEGKNRQVRRMLQAVGYEVIRLHRIKEANIELGNLRPGEYRLLKPFELVSLKKYLGIR